MRDCRMGLELGSKLQMGNIEGDFCYRVSFEQ